jgi:hypothetical protein
MRPLLYAAALMVLALASLVYFAIMIMHIPGGLFKVLIAPALMMLLVIISGIPKKPIG